MYILVQHFITPLCSKILSKQLINHLLTFLISFNIQLDCFVKNIRTLQLSNHNEAFLCIVASWKCIHLKLKCIPVMKSDYPRSQRITARKYYWWPFLPLTKLFTATSFLLLSSLLKRCSPLALMSAVVHRETDMFCIRFGTVMTITQHCSPIIRSFNGQFHMVCSQVRGKSFHLMCRSRSLAK